MAYQGYGQAPAAGYGAPQQQPGYGAPPGAPGYGAPPGGQPGYGAPPGGQPGYGAPQGYGAPPGGQPGAYGAPGGINPQVQAWFAAVDADRSGRITAQELQQALTNANWSHFNPEVCRQMVGMFDRDMSGTIDMNEFGALWTYITQWKQTFEQFDANKSGAIEANELHRAFQQMGYNVSINFVNFLVMKFDYNARRQLTLDHFIQASVMLKSLTDAFRQRDTQQRGTIQIGYEDFMTVSMHCKP